MLAVLRMEWIQVGGNTLSGNCMDIRFVEMPEVVARALETGPERNVETVDDVLEADTAARIAAGEFVCSHRSLAGG